MTGAVAPVSAAAARADEVASHTLLNCVAREVCGPAGHVSVAGGHLVLRLPRTGAVVRVGLRRRSLTGAHRFAGVPEELAGAEWAALTADGLARRVAAELEAATGVVNQEFAAQVRESRGAVTRALELRGARPPSALPEGLGGPGWAARAEAYLASEQSLAYGHRFHPAPKARRTVAGPSSIGGGGEDARTWRRYAPEAGVRFRLRLLAVREDLLREGTAPGGGFPPGLQAAALAAGLPPGYRVLPVHPWQFEILTGGTGGELAGRPYPGAPGTLRGALRAGLLVDLGASGPVVAPTASVRTLYDPAGDAFYKTSLHVRITNCVRRSASYELRGAVALTRLLAPVEADLAARFPGFGLLAEPAYRAVGEPGGRLGAGGGLAGRPDAPPAGTGPDLADALGMIVREGLAARLGAGVTPLLAAAVADEHPGGPAHVSALLARLSARTGAAPEDAALRWWQRYVNLLVPPVLHAYARHGVLLEPHLQNVLVGVDPDGLPCQVLHRDLEGVKLLAPPAGLPAGLRAQVAYPAARGWDRVAYCLLVNHVGETAAALADLHPALEPALWEVVRAELATCADELAGPEPLRGLLAGGPLPAKANLLTRWARAADRHARYVPAPNPFRTAQPSRPASDPSDPSEPETP